MSYFGDYEAIERKTLKCGARQKYIVIKINDAEEHLMDEEQKELCRLSQEISRMRRHYGKSDNEYLVINTDEPYVDEIIAILKRNGHWG